MHTAVAEARRMVGEGDRNVMATYLAEPLVSSLKLQERHIYGSDRLGMDLLPMELHGLSTLDLNGTVPTTGYAGQRRFELKDHLGNVCVTITGDRYGVDQTPQDGFVDYSVPKIVGWAGYEPFGSLLPGRNYNAENYRFGFTGMEKDEEVHGSTGTSYTTEFRQYDPRIGRWMSLDPLLSKFPAWSPYSFAFDNPIAFTDKHGDAPGKDGDERASKAKDVVKNYQEKGTKYSQSDRSTGLDAEYADCSSFVTTVLSQAGQSTLFKTQYTGSGGGGGIQGEIKEKAGAAELKDPYRLTAPAAGDIMMWGGHVAIVTEVTATKMYFAHMGSHGAAIGEIKLTDGAVSVADADKWGSGGFYGFWTPPETADAGTETKPCLDATNAVEVVAAGQKANREALNVNKCLIEQAAGAAEQFQQDASTISSEYDDIWELVKKADQILGTNNAAQRPR